MNGTVTREDFNKADIDGKLGIIFETLQSREVTCDKRFLALEKQKKTNAVLAGTGGFIGGITTVIAYIKLFLPVSKG